MTDIRPLIWVHDEDLARPSVEIIGNARVRIFTIGNVVEVRRERMVVTLANSTFTIETKTGELGHGNMADLVIRAAQGQGLPIEYIEGAYEKATTDE